MNGARIDFACPKLLLIMAIGASVSMSAMQVSASESDRNTVAIAFEPMVVMARYGQSSLRGACVRSSTQLLLNASVNSVFTWV